jgi:hypothetical protein
LLNLSITVDGEAQLVRRLTRVSENLIDFTGPTGKAAQKAFQGEEFDQFFTEGRKSWPQLSPKYQAWKDEHFPFRSGERQREGADTCRRNWKILNDVDAKIQRQQVIWASAYQHPGTGRKGLQSGVELGRRGGVTGYCGYKHAVDINHEISGALYRPEAVSFTGI